MHYVEIENKVTGERMALLHRNIDRLHEKIHSMGEDWKIIFHEYTSDD